MPIALLAAMLPAPDANCEKDGVDCIMRLLVARNTAKSSRKLVESRVAQPHDGKCRQIVRSKGPQPHRQKEAPMSFRDNLQHLCATRNMTQEQLAMLLGVSRQSVSKWEAERAYPEMDKLLKICDLFDCSLDDFGLGRPDLTSFRFCALHTRRRRAHRRDRIRRCHAPFCQSAPPPASPCAS